MKRKVLMLSLLPLVLSAGVLSCKGSEANTAEIAVVTDLGSLMDGSFNQGTWEGAEEYAKEHNKTVKYYQPPNTTEATDADRISAMNAAVDNGAKIVVTPGFAQAVALQDVAKNNPDVKFVFIDGWNLGIDNVTAISYNEHEAAYMAGYAAVKEGYKKLGGTFGGSGTNLACNRFAYGYVQGINDAAAGVSGVECKISFKFSGGYSASPDLQSQMSTWYSEGTEVIFGCGGSMVNSVKAAAEAVTETDTKKAKIIGVDVDQKSLSERVITSATKGLKVSVKKVLGQFYDGKWDAELKDKLQQLGAKDDATGIAYHSDRLKTFTEAQYKELLGKVKDGTIKIEADANALSDVSKDAFWTSANSKFKNVNIVFEAETK